MTWRRVTSSDLVTWPWKVGGHHLQTSRKIDQWIVMQNFAALRAAVFLFFKNLGGRPPVGARVKIAAIVLSIMTTTFSGTTINETQPAGNAVRQLARTRTGALSLLHHLWFPTAYLLVLRRSGVGFRVRVNILESQSDRSRWKCVNSAAIAFLVY